MRVQSKTKLLNSLDKRIAGYDYAKAMKNAKQKVEELQQLKKDINEGNSVQEGYLSFFAMRNNNKHYKIDDALGRVSSQVETAGHLPQKETFMKLPMLLSAFPLNFKTDNLDFFERKIFLTAWQCARASPLYGDIKGNTSDPSEFFITRRSQLFSFDLLLSRRMITGCLSSDLPEQEKLI